jgi:hypothetical protein
VLQKIKGIADMNEKIDSMFLAALSRPATESEKKRYGTFLANGRIEDAYWTLLNTTEFVTRH